MSRPVLSESVRLTLIVALHEEARPLVRHLGLKADERARGFRCFVGDSTQLVVSGVGRERAGMATAYAAARVAVPENSVFLNVGICGSGLDGDGGVVGQSLLAHRVTERTTGKMVLPSIAFVPPVPTAAVMTCDDVERSYGESTLYEMEASGFFAAALRFGTAELVQAVKVVSDSPREPVESLDGKRVSELVEGALGAIDEVLGLLKPLQATLVAREDASELAAAWSEDCDLSVTQARQLERLAARFLALGLGQLPEGVVNQRSRPRDFLRSVQDFVDAAAVSHAPQAGGATP